ncbi:hypothetical protein R3P38DRAFT_3435831 [Favolaschia claudopus]|uniref:Uncharacterized protein n=1 Tax=Favolaschia claudopus TaxID=2862362 RepID=A0AAV9ZTW1_9AGAR
MGLGQKCPSPFAQNRGSPDNQVHGTSWQLCEYFKSSTIAIETARADPAHYRCHEAENSCAPHAVSNNPTSARRLPRSRTASFDVVAQGELKDAGHPAGALAADAAPCAQWAAGELLVGGEGESGVEEAVHHFGYDAGGDFRVEGGEGEVGGGEEEGEGGGDVVGAVGEDEDAGVEKAEGKAEEVGVKQGRVRVMGWEEEEERNRTGAHSFPFLAAHSVNDFAAAPPDLDLPHHSAWFALVVAASVQTALWSSVGQGFAGQGLRTCGKRDACASMLL